MDRRKPANLVVTISLARVSRWEGVGNERHALHLPGNSGTLLDQSQRWLPQLPQCCTSRRSTLPYRPSPPQSLIEEREDNRMTLKPAWQTCYATVAMVTADVWHQRVAQTMPLNERVIYSSSNSAPGKRAIFFTRAVYLPLITTISCLELVDSFPGGGSARQPFLDSLAFGFCLCLLPPLFARGHVMTSPLLIFSRFELRLSNIY